MLTENEKYLCGILFVLFLIATVLAIYFGIKANKNCTGTGLPESPTLKSFNVVQDSDSWAWNIPTWYKYSYVDKNNNEGKLSQPSDAVRATNTNQTNPIIKLNAERENLKNYSVKVYRSTTEQNGTYRLINPTITNGTFVDKDNPSPRPHPPPSIPIPQKPTFSDWQDGGGGGGGPKCPDSSTKCSSSYCTQDQIGNCTNSDSPWSCYSGVAGCSRDANTLENEDGCSQYCFVQH